MFNVMVRARELEKENKRIIHFEIGDPNFNSPEKAIKALQRSISNNQTHYTNSLGIDELRNAVIQRTKKDYGFTPDINQILIAPANAIIDYVIRCVADIGDEIMFPDPGFPTYIAAVMYNGMKPVPIPLLQESNFKINTSYVNSKITKKTKLIIINSPNNPIGSILNDINVQQVALLAKNNSCFLLSDEVYSKIVYDKKFYSPSSLDKCKERTIILQSLSKTYSMSGWRVGYAIGPERLIENMGRLQQTIISCLPAFTQYGAIDALLYCDKEIADRNKELKKRRDTLVSGLNKLQGVICKKPDGAFYVFPNIERTGMTSVEFSNKMIDAGVCVLPGDCFGVNGHGFIRMSYASVSIDEIKEALDIMKGVLNG